MANVRDPFSADAWRDPKVLHVLRLNRDIAAHFAEAVPETDTTEPSELLKFIEKLHIEAKKLPADRTDYEANITWTGLERKIANEADARPHFMQALMTLYGKAPKPGDSEPRSEPLQEQHLQAVAELIDAEEAKATGNDHFKNQAISMALAHYQRAMVLVRKRQPLDVLALVPLLSNSALCLIKLDFPDRAKTSCSHALTEIQKLKDQKFDQSKLFYRRALACEQLDELANAEDDMKRAMKEAERIGLGAPEQQRLRKEYQRMHLLHKIQIDEHKKKDMQKGYWGAFVKSDAVADYEEANKWSSNTSKIEERFESTGVETHFDKWSNRATTAKEVEEQMCPDGSSDKQPIAESKAT